MTVKYGIRFIDEAVKTIRTMAKLFLKKGNKRVSAFLKTGRALLKIQGIPGEKEKNTRH